VRTRSEELRRRSIELAKIATETVIASRDVFARSESLLDELARQRRARAK
jgi:hypothetical protein